MESVLTLIFSAENVRMLVLLAFGFSGYVLIKSSFKELRHDVEASIKELRHDVYNSIGELRHGVDTSISELRHGVDTSISELKHNDLAHIQGALEALIFTLEKNGNLTLDDKEYISRTLSR